jgi:hypothetical protein
MNSIDWGHWGRVATIIAGCLLYVWAQRLAIQGELERDADDDAEQWV